MVKKGVSMVKTVEPFKPGYMHKILPLVYDDSLSYYESVCKMVAKLNEVIEALESISVDILDEAKQYTDTAIAQSQTEIDIRIQQLNDLITATTQQFNQQLLALQRQYSEFTENVDANLSVFNGRLNDFRTELTNSIIGVNERTDLAIQQNNEYIFEVIGGHLETEVKVINMFTGARVSIQDMFNYLGNLHVEDGAIIDDFEEADKTVNEIVALDESCTRWVMYGHSILGLT